MGTALSCGVLTVLCEVVGDSHSQISPFAWRTAFFLTLPMAVGVVVLTNRLLGDRDFSVVSIEPPEPDSEVRVLPEHYEERPRQDLSLFPRNPRFDLFILVGDVSRASSASS